MQCVHRTGRKDWAPMQNGILKLHPYCGMCGTLKNVSSDRGKKISYFVSSLSKLRKILEKKGYKISEAQVRLIMKELSEIEGFDDTWWVTFTRQREIFISVVKKYIRVSEDVIKSVL